MAERVPDILVELLALGELEQSEASEVRARLAAEGDRRLEEIARSNEEILAQYPVSVEVEQLRHLAERQTAVRTLERPSDRRGRAVATAALVSLAAAVVLVWVLRAHDDEGGATSPVVAHAPVPTPTPRPGDGVRDKGRQRLFVHRKGDDEALAAGQPVTAGDLLQLSYKASNGRYGVIVSVDGGGLAVLHWPVEETGDTQLARGVVRLDHAYELDDAPGFERFFFVTADVPIDPSQVMQAARRLARDPQARTQALALPERWEQTSILLPKRGHG